MPLKQCRHDFEQSFLSPTPAENQAYAIAPSEKSMKEGKREEEKDKNEKETKKTEKNKLSRKNDKPSTDFEILQVSSSLGKELRFKQADASSQTDLLEKKRICGI